MRTILLILLALCTVMTVAVAQNAQTPNLMPLPSNTQLGTGWLPIDTSFSIAIEGYSEQRLTDAAARATATIARETGLAIGADPKAQKSRTLVVHADHASEAVQKVGEDESYELTVTTSGAQLKAANPLGILRGLQTFVQLVELTPTGYSVPVVTIHDSPRFPWRGLMIDVSRHWQPVNVIERNLDGMEAVKLNVFHWHLSDNQGFRVESKKYPKLQELGSDGHYYTQEQVKEVIAYARERGIRVMPEFEMPGHATAMLAAYPEIATKPGPNTADRLYGVLDPAVDPTNEATYKFLNGLIGEMAALFPDAYFHIGGDEVNGKAWDASPDVQKYMHEHGIKSNAELQTYFTKRVQAIVAKHHKIMVGWDEILSPDLPKDIVIQSWRGPDSLAVAAQEGYKGLLSYGFYLDLFQSAAFHYLNEPISGKAAQLSDQEKKMILGGEACMWSELATAELMDSRIWPRMAAIAERLWSPQNTRDVRSMYARMEAESMRLEWLGLQHRSYYRPALERLVGSSDIDAIRTLADVVQAPPEYKRGELHFAATGHEYMSTESYNRLVDAAHPESMTAVRFNFMVEDLLAGKATPAEVAEMRTLLSAWRDNDVKLRHQIASSYLLKEVSPLSENLTIVGSTGLLALDYLQSGSKPAPGWSEKQLAALAATSTPQAELLIAVTPGVEKLVRAAAQITEPIGTRNPQQQ